MIELQIPGTVTSHVKQASGVVYISRDITSGSKSYTYINKIVGGKLISSPMAVIQGKIHSMVEVEGQLIVGGDFTHQGSSYLVALDIKTLQKSNLVLPKVDAMVFAVDYDPNRKTLYVTGDFGTVSTKEADFERQGIVGLQIERERRRVSVTPLDIPLMGPATLLKVLSTGSLLVGGSTSIYPAENYKGPLPQGLFKIDPSSNSVEKFEPNPNNLVTGATEDVDTGAIIVHGAFTHIAGIESNGVVALDPNTGEALDSPNLSGLSGVTGLLIDSKNSQIYSYAGYNLLASGAVGLNYDFKVGEDKPFIKIAALDLKGEIIPLDTSSFVQKCSSVPRDLVFMDDSSGALVAVSNRNACPKN
jgi:hypothetical protein